MPCPPLGGTRKDEDNIQMGISLSSSDIWPQLKAKASIKPAHFFRTVCVCVGGGASWYRVGSGNVANGITIITGNGKGDLVYTVGNTHLTQAD